MIQTSLVFDMRAPDFGTSAKDLYPAALEMIEYADEHGIDQVSFQEHHGSEDGYLPAPFLMGSAAAARTRRIDIVLGAVILPLHDPVKIAEMIAVGDLISGGRMHVVLAAGYAQHEFKAFGVSLADRARLMDEGVEIILRALSGERFKHKDREVFVRPLPASQPPNVYIGGGVAASARRAARFGLGMWPMKDEIIPIYEEECRKLGREPGRILYGSVGIHVCEDPDAGWAEIGPHILHYMRSYASWSTSPDVSSSPMHGIDSLEAIRASGIFRVLTPDEAVELARTKAVGLLPLLAGLKPEIGWRSLELFVSKVLPRLSTQARSGQGR